MKRCLTVALYLALVLLVVSPVYGDKSFGQCSEKIFQERSPAGEKFLEIVHRHLKSNSAKFKHRIASNKFNHLVNLFGESFTELQEFQKQTSMVQRFEYLSTKAQHTEQILKYFVKSISNTFARNYLFTYLYKALCDQKYRLSDIRGSFSDDSPLKKKEFIKELQEIEAQFLTTMIKEFTYLVNQTSVDQKSHLQKLAKNGLREVKDAKIKAIFPYSDAGYGDLLEPEAEAFSAFARQNPNIRFLFLGDPAVRHALGAPSFSNIADSMLYNESTKEFVIMEQKAFSSYEYFKKALFQIETTVRFLKSYDPRLAHAKVKLYVNIRESDFKDLSKYSLEVDEAGIIFKISYNKGVMTKEPIRILGQPVFIFAHGEWSN